MVSKDLFGFQGHPLLPATACLAPGRLSGVLPKEGLEQLQPFFFLRTAGLRPTSATKQRPPAVKGEVDEQVFLLSPDIASKTIAVLIAKERETRTPSFATDEENDTKKARLLPTRPPSRGTGMQLPESPGPSAKVGAPELLTTCSP